MTVNADGTVQILAEEAFPLDMLDVQVHPPSHVICKLRPPQAARQGLDKCKQQRSSAATDTERAEADIGVELYETLIRALE